MLPMTAIFAIVIVPSYLASTANSYYYGAGHMFGPDTQLGADTASIEDAFGKSDTYVLLVPNDSTARQKALSDELHTIPEIKSIVSYVDMAGAEIPMDYLDPDTLSQLVSEHYSRMVLTVEADYEGEDTFRLVSEIRAVAESHYPGQWHLAGEGVSTYDLMNTVTRDMVKVNLVAILAVFAVLLALLRSAVLPVILVLSIETAIWLNLSLPYFTDSYVFYIAYLIISSIQLGATVDYAILLSDRYREFRQTMDKKQAVVETVSAVTVSILTSGSVLSVAGFLLGAISSNGLLAQLGTFLGVGAICSLVIVLFVLPGLLYLFDRLFLPKRNVRRLPCNRRFSMIKYKKCFRRICAVLLALLVTVSALPAGTAYAAQNISKEEVVYVNLNADGSVSEVYVVNSFDLSSAGKIVDYGRYSAVRNMTTTDAVEYANELTTIAAPAGKLYYEGTLDSKVLPWKFEFRYWLDGKEYTAGDLAGKSGKLEISMQVRENTACSGTFSQTTPSSSLCPWIPIRPNILRPRALPPPMWVPTNSSLGRSCPGRGRISR